MKVEAKRTVTMGNRLLPVPQQWAKLLKSVISWLSKELFKSSALYQECNSKSIRRSKSTARSAFLVLKAPREGHNQQEYSSFYKKNTSRSAQRTKISSF